MERVEDARKYALGSANIIHRVSVLYIYYIVKGEGGGCYRIYTLSSGHIIDSVNVLYIYYKLKRRGRRMLQNIHWPLAIYYTVSVLYKLHAKKEREEDATEYTLAMAIYYTV